MLADILLKKAHCTSAPKHKNNIMSAPPPPRSLVFHNDETAFELQNNVVKSGHSHRSAGLQHDDTSGRLSTLTTSTRRKSKLILKIFHSYKNLIRRSQGRKKKAKSLNTKYQSVRNSRPTDLGSTWPWELGGGDNCD